MTDVRKGDLVKATKGERVVIGRAHEPGRGYLDIEDFSTIDPVSEWDLEVLDRPIPPVPDELVRACRDAYVGVTGPDDSRVVYHDDWVKVINTVREFDRTNNKESAK